MRRYAPLQKRRKAGKRGARFVPLDKPPGKMICFVRLSGFIPDGSNTNQPLNAAFVRLVVLPHCNASGIAASSSRQFISKYAV